MCKRRMLYAYREHLTISPRTSHKNKLKEFPIPVSVRDCLVDPELWQDNLTTAFGRLLLDEQCARIRNDLSL